MTLDGSLGPQGALSGPDYRIGHDLGQVRGSNLFHSFGRFDLIKGESATFTGPNTIANILSRVTGGSPSSIDGLLRSTIPGANLFLLNPSGVLFGPNATLDVSGSFHVSTADFLRFEDGERFSTRLSETGVLTTAPPAAFGFLGGSPAAISIEGSTLQVPEGKMLSVVGGGMAMQGGLLSAPGGWINLAGVASAGEVVPTLRDRFPALEVQGFGPLGELALSAGARVDASGPGGAVLIRGGRLVLDQSTISAKTLGSGIGQGIDVKVESLSLTGGAFMTTDSQGTGPGGALKIEATGSVSISGSGPLGPGILSGSPVGNALRLSSGPDRPALPVELPVEPSSLSAPEGEEALPRGPFPQAFAPVFPQGFDPAAGGPVSLPQVISTPASGLGSQGSTIPSGLYCNASGSGAGGPVLLSAASLEMDGGVIQSVAT